jgi:hypothetical protein
VLQVSLAIDLSFYLDSFDLCKLLYVLEANGEVFGFGMLYWVHGDFYETFVVTIYGHC